VKRPTKPAHWLDFTLWPLLVVTWDRLVKKTSHFWHYVEYRGQPVLTVSLPPDEQAGDRSKGLWSNLFQSDFGWKQVGILEPVNHTGTYQLGFIATEGGEFKKQLCTIILTGQVGLLRGPYATEFFAVDLQGKPVELRVVGLTTKKELRGIPLI
jgi:hypothetical protein